MKHSQEIADEMLDALKGALPESTEFEDNYFRFQPWLHISIASGEVTDPTDLAIHLVREALEFKPFDPPEEQALVLSIEAGSVENPAWVASESLETLVLAEARECALWYWRLPCNWTEEQRECAIEKHRPIAAQQVRARAAHLERIASDLRAFADKLQHETEASE